MNASRRLRVPLLLAALFVLPAARPAAADVELGEAPKLYASAAFEEALAVLDRVNLTGARPDEIASVHRYRAGCLMALGRSSDAERAMEAVARAQPELVAAKFDESPRMREAYASVRARILPQVVRDLFASARTAYTENAPDAGERFQRVLALLADPALGGNPAAALADIKTLAEGFSELLDAKAEAAAPPPAPPAPEPQRLFYTTDDTDVLPPRVITQHVPRPPVLPSRTVAFTGTVSLELTISSEGLVEGAVITQSLNPIYDAMLLDAAKRWRYDPAVREGTPVRFRKKLDIVVKNE
jgi:TonB family protein